MHAEPTKQVAPTEDGEPTLGRTAVAISCIKPAKGDELDGVGETAKQVSEISFAGETNEP